MVYDNASPDSPGENHQPNTDANLPSEKDTAIDALAKVQESLSLGKRHYKFWETQPVGQFKEVGDYSSPEGTIEPPTPLSEVKQEPYVLPSLYEWITRDIDSEEML